MSQDPEAGAEASVGVGRADEGAEGRDRCFVIVPVGGGIDRECEAGLRGLEALGYRVFREYGWSDIGRGRSALATRALAEGAESIMWIDSDIGFRAEDVDRLRGWGVSVVGGLYPVKGQRRLASALEPWTREICFGARARLTRVKYLAGGFLYTRREVYERMREGLGLPWCGVEGEVGIVPYFTHLIVPHENGKNQTLLSEDFSFCERARRVGYEMWGDPSIRLRHVGRYGYSWEDAGGEMTRHDPYFLGTGG